MKHIKRILLATFLLVSSIALSSFSVRANESMQADFMEGGIEKWLTYEGDNTQIVENDFNNNKSLGLITNITKNSVRAASPIFLANNSEDGIFYISYNFMVNQSNESGFTPERYLKLINADSISSTPTVSVNFTKVKDSGLYIGSNSTSLATINDKTIYNIKLKVDTKNSTIEAWLDSQKITSTPVSFSKPSKMDYSKTRIMFTNQYSKAVGKSEFYIYNAYAESRNTLNVVSTPDNGEIVSASKLEKVSVDLGMIPFGNYSVKMYKMQGSGSEEITELDIKENGSKIEITAVQGFEEMFTYKVNITGLEDSYGNALGSVEFQFDTAFDGYSKPDVSIINQDTTGKVGQRIDLQAEAESECASIDKIEFYINDELIEGNIWIPTKAGQYDIYAVAYDNYGGSNKSQTVTFNIAFNEAPRISFVLNEMTSPKELESFTVQATDSDGTVTNVKVFVDGKLIEEQFTSTEYIFDLSDCNLGKHTICIQAEDDTGAISKEEKATIVVVFEEKIGNNYDFEDYTTSNPMGGKVNGGTFKPLKLDEQHGTSLAVVVDGNTPDGWGGPYTEIGTAETKDIVSIKFDFCLSLASMQMHFETRGEAKSSDFEIKNGYLSVHNGSAVALSAMKWYSVEYTFYPQENKFDFVMYDGENVLCQYKELPSKTSNVNKVSGFRIYVDGRTQKEETAYIDNVSLTRKIMYPYIQKVYGESSEEGVGYLDENLFIEFSGPVIIPEECEITLENEMGSMPVEATEFIQDNLLKITPKYGLDSASQYRILFGEKLSGDDGKPLGKKTEAVFKTTSKQFDVTEGMFSDSSELFFTTEIDNKTGKDEEITVIMIVYKNGVFNRVLCKKQTVYANETTQISTPSVQKETGVTAKGFTVYDDSKCPVSNKIYQYN